MAIDIRSFAEAPPSKPPRPPIIFIDTDSVTR